MAAAVRHRALYALAFLVVAIGSAAGVMSRGVAWLPRYDLSDTGRRTLTLPPALTEASGLAFDGHGRLLAHHDESATLYVVDPADASITRSIPVGERRMRGDFEGVAVAGDRIFMVTSGGTLLEVEVPPEGRAEAARMVDTGLGRVCEVEGLAYDPAGAALLLPCKVTYRKQLDDRLLVYAVPLATLALDPQPRLSVPHSALKAAGLTGRFRASAIDVHPRSGSLFLVDARQAAIVEISADGRLLAARRLSRKAHPQAEGLAFGPGLDLWIADEGRRRGLLTRYRLAERAATKEQRE